jgi:Ferric reductase like transmembrane component/Class III cytochrome C family
MRPDGACVRGLDPRYRLWGAAFLLLATAPALVGLVSPAWEISQLAGFASGIACILLCGCPVRPRDAVPPTLLSLHHHQLIGWAALIGAVLHIGGLLLADPTVVEYLKPTAPFYQLAGIAATVLLLVVVLSSLVSVRRWWASHRGFQATHVSLGLLLVALIAAHVVVTDRYVGGATRRALFVLVTIGAIAMPLRARAPGIARRAVGMGQQFVFGRHSKWVVCVVAIAIVAIAGLVPDGVRATLREPALHRTAALPLDFQHDRHTDVNCLFCHHNYVDKTGFDTCIPCHRGQRPDLMEGDQSRFHSFCFGCHRHPDAKFAHHGPASGCVACHQAPGTSERAHKDPSSRSGAPSR